MRKFLVLVLMVVGIVACSNKNEVRFLGLMKATKFGHPDIVTYFTDDF